MSNPVASSTGEDITSSGGMAAAAPSMAHTTSMAVSSRASRLSGRKKNVSRSVLKSADASTPCSDIVNHTFMVAGTVEFTGIDGLPDKASQLQSSSKIVCRVAKSGHRLDPVPRKPSKVMKISLHAVKPSHGGAVASSSSRSHIQNSLSIACFIAFVVVAGLAITVWQRKVSLSLVHTSSSDGQVADFEEISRKTFTMMQLRLKLVDMKIHKELEWLRKEFQEKIDEKATIFDSRLHEILAKAFEIEASLKTFTNTWFSSKQDVLGLINSVVENRAAEGTGKILSLDDVHAVARLTVEVQLDKHAADGIGKVDYALGSGGGKVIDHSGGVYDGFKNFWHLLAWVFLPGASNKHPLAQKVLQPSFGEPGQCLPLNGRNVYVEIALRTSIYPDSFSLEHVAKGLNSFLQIQRTFVVVNQSKLFFQGMKRKFICCLQSSML